MPTIPRAVAPKVFIKINWTDSWTEAPAFVVESITHTTVSCGPDTATLIRRYGMIKDIGSNSFESRTHTEAFDNGWVMIKGGDESYTTTLFLGQVVSVEDRIDGSLANGETGVQTFHCKGGAYILKRIPIWQSLHGGLIPEANQTVLRTVDWVPEYNGESLYTDRMTGEKTFRPSNMHGTYDNKSVYFLIGAPMSSITLNTVNDMMTYAGTLLDKYVNSNSCPRFVFDWSQARWVGSLGAAKCSPPVVDNLYDFITRWINPSIGADMVLRPASNGYLIEVFSLASSESTNFGYPANQVNTNTYSIPTDDYRINSLTITKSKNSNYKKIRLIGERIIIQDVMAGDYVIDGISAKCQNVLKLRPLFQGDDEITLKKYFGVTMLNQNLTERGCPYAPYFTVDNQGNPSYHNGPDLQYDCQFYRTLDHRYNTKGSVVSGVLALIDGTEFLARHKILDGNITTFPLDAPVGTSKYKMMYVSDVELGAKPLSFGRGVEIQSNPINRLFCGYASNGTTKDYNLDAVLDPSMYIWQLYAYNYAYDTKEQPDLSYGTMVVSFAWECDQRYQMTFQTDDATDHDPELIIYAKDALCVFCRSYLNSSEYDEVIDESDINIVGSGGLHIWTSSDSQSRINCFSNTFLRKDFVPSEQTGNGYMKYLYNWYRTLENRTQLSIQYKDSLAIGNLVGRMITGIGDGERREAIQSVCTSVHWSFNSKGLASTTINTGYGSSK